jgi:hypothetical protein
MKIEDSLNLNESLQQMPGYTDSCGTSEGWLAVSDKNFNPERSEKIKRETFNYRQGAVHTAGC